MEALICPDCGYQVRSADAYTAGRLLCTQCGARMARPEAEPAPAPPEPPAPAPAAAPPPPPQTPPPRPRIQVVGHAPAAAGEARWFTTCTDCGGRVSRRALACALCGAPRPTAMPAAPRGGRPSLARPLYGLLGSLLLYLALASALRTLRFVGPLAPLNLGGGPTPILIGLGALSLLATLLQRYHWLWVTGLGSLALAALVFINFQIRVTAVAGQVAEDEEALRLVATLAADSIALQWGGGAVVVAGALLLAAAARRET